MAEPTPIPQDEFDNWVRVAPVVAALKAHIPNTWMEALVGRIHSGSIRIAAGELTAISERGDHQTGWRIHLPRPAWIMYASDKFWEMGDHTAYEARDNTGYGGHRVAAEIHGVRINPDDLAGFYADVGLPAPTASVTSPAESPLAVGRQGGRPPNPHWEEAINTIWKAIYEGWQPTRQAEIETRLAEWFSSSGKEEPGQTQRRQRARMIWTALDEGVGN